MADGEVEAEEEVVVVDQVGADHRKMGSQECRACHLCHSRSLNLCHPIRTQNQSSGVQIDHLKIGHRQHL